MTTFENVRVNIDENIATVTVDRPEAHNAMDIPTRRELRTGLDALRDEPIRVIVFRGAGDNSFISGADIETLAQMDLVEALEYATRHSQGLYNYVADLSVPTIAAVDGYCLGGGLELALACDIRVATEDAQFGLPEVTLGLLPGGGGTQRLQAVVGAGVARELVLTGKHIDAQRAKCDGLVNSVYDSNTFEAKVRAVAEEIAANAPVAVRLAKESMNRGLDVEAGLDFERMAFVVAAVTTDKDEGTTAFLQNREPSFEGR